MASDAGSATNLEVAGRTLQFFTSSVGARASWSYRQDGQLNARAVWSRELRGLDSERTARLASSTSDTRFLIRGAPFERDALTLGAGYSGNLNGVRRLCARNARAEVQHTEFAKVRYVW